MFRGIDLQALEVNLRLVLNCKSVLLNVLIFSLNFKAPKDSCRPFSLDLQYTYYLPGGDSVGLLVAPSFRMTAVRRRNVNCIFAVD